MTEQQILDLFEKVYCKKYIGKLKIEELEHGFRVTLGMGCPERPIVISADLPEKDFLSFFEQELHERHLNTSNYFVGERVYPYDERRTD